MSTSNLSTSSPSSHPSTNGANVLQYPPAAVSPQVVAAPTMPYPEFKSAFGQVTVPPFLADSQTHEWKGDLIYKAHRSMGSYDTEWLWLMIAWFVTVPLALLLLSAGTPAGILLLLWPCGAWLILALKAWSTRYYIYQNRIDFETGLISKRIVPLWLWQIKEVEYYCSILDRLTGGSEIKLLVAKVTHEQVEGVVGLKLIGLPSARPDWGPNKFMEELYHELLDAAVQKRRTMKNWFQ